jgi:guanylate kinase
MDGSEEKERYRRLLQDIPRISCDIKALQNHGRDTLKLEESLETKKEELSELTRKIHSVGKEQGVLLVVSAPSGTGKTTLCKQLLKMVQDLRFSISYTTRAPRRGERNGKDYHFITKQEFKDKIDREEFVEWAENYGNLYGTSYQEIRNALDKNMDILLDVDPRGARAIKKHYTNGAFVFILPPSIDILSKRLTGRGSEKDDMIKVRLNKAMDEIKEVVWYDYVIFNDTIQSSVDMLRSIYMAEKSKRIRLMEKIENLMNNRRYY